ncbi:hypothetical protein [Sphingomonas crusticola]|uniref:hypothetical protein n=1 Tax=Sphingomonas crusticola TaxID=1697973 RepID=UPI001F07E8DB|nr:hypothetical protein [Sphingomonas crusticola]
MLLGLAIVETIVIHIVVMALWGWKVALVLGVIDLSLIASLLWLLRAIRRHPVTMADDVLVMRIGKLVVVPIPYAQISGLRSSWDAAALKQKGVVNLALATWPNVFVDLSPPVVSGRRRISRVAHKLDDPSAFRAAIMDLRSDA